VKISSQELAQKAEIIARDRWAQFTGSRLILVRELTFVREQEDNHWIDLAGVPWAEAWFNTKGYKPSTYLIIGCSRFSRPA
jgi:hypothetical protein